MAEHPLPTSTSLTKVPDTFLSAASAVRFSGYLKRLWKNYLRQHVPWARDQIAWGAIMLIAPVFAVYLIHGSKIDWPIIKTTLWLYGAAFGIYSGIHIARAVWKLHQAQETAIGEKDKQIRELGDNMVARAEDTAAQINQGVGAIYKLNEEIGRIKSQLALTEEKLYASERELANERNRITQPDVGLMWDWPASERETKSLMGYTEKLIIVENRSDGFIYNVQIESIKLYQELSFDLINEIAPKKEHVALGRWNGRSSVQTNYIYFFGKEENEKEMSNKGWVFKKVHNRGLSDAFLLIPMALTYESKNGLRWRTEFEFIYDPGDGSLFTKKSGSRI
jgi:hypothetical protein